MMGLVLAVLEALLLALLEVFVLEFVLALL
jgi:hypothetical protein